MSCYLENSMAISAEDAPTLPGTGLVDRFRSLLSALHPDGTSHAAATWMRFAALSLVPEPGDPRELAHEVRADAARLRARAPWWGALASPLRFLVASVLRSGGLTAESFVGMVARDREALGRLGLHAREPFDVIASAARALLAGSHRLSALDAERIKLIHDGLTGQHWWLTGPESLPASVLLATHAGTPRDIIAAAEETYQRLLKLGFPRGETLLTSAHLLQLSGLPPAASTERFAQLYHAHLERGGDLSSARFEALALLCLLDHDPVFVARVHQACAARLGEVHPTVHGPLAFALAADLAFLELVRLPQVTAGSETVPKPEDFEHAGRMLGKLRLYQATAAVVAVDCWIGSVTGDGVLDR
jgi:hypothetical protein